MQNVGQQHRNPKQIKQKDKRKIFKCDDLHDRIVVDVLAERETKEEF